MKTFKELLDLAKVCQFEDYAFVLDERDDCFVVFARYNEKDITTGVNSVQTTRKWYVSKHVSKSEFVQTLFKLCLTSMEHRARESFKYRGKRVFGPHFDVDALHQICEEKRFDYRDPAKQDGLEVCAVAQGHTGSIQTENAGKKTPSWAAGESEYGEFLRHHYGRAKLA